MKGPTQQYSDTIKSLQSRIQALEDENRLLKERLEEAGVSYANIVSGDAEGVVELYDPDQGARIKKFDVTDKIASDFFMMFCRGRKDVYDLRYTNPKTGKNGYYSQCFNRWDRGCHIQKKDGVRCKDCELRAYKPVTLPLIKAHMNGQIQMAMMSWRYIRCLKITFVSYLYLILITMQRERSRKIMRILMMAGKKK